MHICPQNSKSILGFNLRNITDNSSIQCQDAVKEEKAYEREAPRDTGKFCAITSRASPSRPSGDSLAVVESSVFPAWSMKRRGVCSRCSWRMWSETLSRTLSTPREKRSRLWTSSMLWRDREELFTTLEVKSAKQKQNQQERTKPPTFFKATQIN